jgi:phage repressor protein C with HTH and peptisase S24 domain
MDKDINLLEIRELYGLSQLEMAQQIGYSREVINKIEKGKMKPSRWLMEAVRQFVSEHQNRKISPGVKKNAGNTGSTFLETRRDQKLAGGNMMVPLVGIKAQAGYVRGFEQTDYLDTLQQYALPPGVHPAGAVWRYFEIDGDSMEPSLQAADIVLATMVPFEDWNEIKNLCVYIVHLEDRLLIKRIQRVSADTWTLLSDNEHYAPQKIMVEDVKQLWQLRRHIRSKVPPPGQSNVA